MGSDRRLFETRRKLELFWRARSQGEKIGLGVAAALLVLLVLRVCVSDTNNLFIMAEGVHFIGLGWLVWKLTKEQTCSGLSLKMQEMTALFLGVRLYCSITMEWNEHTLLDLLTLGVTVWVIYMMRVPLKHTYNSDLDSFNVLYIIGPCALLAFVAHPGFDTGHMFFNRVLWGFCVFIESVSVLPQLSMMQQAQVVERSLANYIFALGVARFLSCAHWLLQLEYFFVAMGSIWGCAVVLSEGVQTFILADFCYWYLKSLAEGAGVVRLPSGVV
mmetsp:Transcript_23116/g.75364  ORF Transcript_23116/g.75364 Transcript_23116/m.75364 type:complete len:273 (+) Transcript_23116:1-819(+)